MRRRCKQIRTGEGRLAEKNRTLGRSSAAERCLVGWSTDASFSDYILKLEFRGSEKVNSGVFLRSQEEAQPHRTGYEIKADDDHFVIVLNGKTLRDARDSK